MMPLRIPEPVLKLHSTFPVSASKARRIPIGSPLNTSPPPVVRALAKPGMVHLIRPFALAREWIARIEPAGFAPIGGHHQPPEIIGASMAGAVILGVFFLGDWFEVAAEIQHIVVPKSGLRVVGTRIPA